MSEIDDIFASKTKPLPPPLPSSSKSSEKAKKKKKKKGKAQDVAPPNPDDLPASTTTTTTSKKRPAPETVVDTSDRIEAPAKRHKGLPASHEEKASRPVKSAKKKTDDDASFKDSRGTANRRTTEEGWTVYKEDELGISGEGGDTPLCPFDCDCCF